MARKLVFNVLSGQFDYIDVTDTSLLYGGIPQHVALAEAHTTPLDKQEPFILDLLQDGDTILDGDEVYV